MEKDIQSNDPDHALDGPILTTFLRYLIPSIIGILAMTSANIVDGIFIGNFVGIEALAAINLLMPFLSLLFGAGLMLSIGGSVRAGKYLGEKNTEAASSIFSKTFITVMLYAAIVITLGLSFKTYLFKALGAPEALFPLMGEYFSIIMPFLAAQLGTIVLYFFIRLDGFPTLTALALVVGAVLNIVLDYLFIVGYDWGLTGAAYATGISQALPFLVLLFYFLYPNKSLQFRLKQKNWTEVLQAAYNGISEFINEISAGIIAFIFNWILIQRAGVDGVAAITVINYLLMIGFMVFFSIADSAQVMISQNFGAKNHQRIKQFLLIAQAHVVVISLILIWLLLNQSSLLIGALIENGDGQKSGARAGAETMQLANEFVGYIWPVFIFVGTNMLISGYFTAMHLPYHSAVLAICRSLVLPASLLLLMSFMFSDYRFVMALPIAEALTFLLAMIFFFRHSPRKQIQS